MKRIELSLKLFCMQELKEVENYMAFFVHLMCQNLNLLDVTTLEWLYVPMRIGNKPRDCKTCHICRFVIIFFTGVRVLISTKNKYHKYITSCGIVNDKFLAMVHSDTSANSVCLNKESDCLFSVTLLEGHTFSFR